MDRDHHRRRRHHRPRQNAWEKIILIFFSRNLRIFFPRVIKNKCSFISNKHLIICQCVPYK